MEEQKYIEYTTQEGDRLDLIALKVYGDSYEWSSLLSENPTLPILSQYRGGIKIRVLAKSRNEKTANPNFLPPWKR